MRTRTGVALAAAAGLIGAAAVGVPAVLAADDDRPDQGRFGMMWSDDAPRWDDERGFGRMGGWMHGGRGGWGGGWGGMGPGLGAAGPCGWADGEPAGKLTADQEDDLADFAEREKPGPGPLHRLRRRRRRPAPSACSRGRSRTTSGRQASARALRRRGPDRGQRPGCSSPTTPWPRTRRDARGRLEVARRRRSRWPGDLEEGFVDTLGDAADRLETPPRPWRGPTSTSPSTPKRHLDVLSD